MLERKIQSHKLSHGSLVAITAILGAQVFLAYSPSFSERQLNSPGLQLLPSKMGDWITVGEQEMEPEVKEYLRPDEYIMRDYRAGNGMGSVSLFVAYFKSVQNGYGPHSPSVCLPGSGWLTRMQRNVRLSVPGRSEGIPVNEYALEKNGQQILVLYWYQNERRAWADELQSKLLLTPDLIRYRRSDVALVRIVTPLIKNESLAEPLQYSLAFIQDLFPRLSERLAATT